LWYDLSDPGNTVTSGAYATVIDKSGNSNHATQSNASQCPTQIVGGQNGLNTARFTSVNTQRMNLTSTLNSGTSYTCFCVCRRAGPSGSNLIEVLGNSGTSSIALLEWYSNSVFYANSTAGYIRGNPQSSTAYNAVYALYIGNSSSKIYFNNTDVTGTWTASGTPSNIFNVFGYGDAAYSNGEIGEFGVYSGQITAQQLASLQSYLKAKWATP
jgi:hypothetical protein